MKISKKVLGIAIIVLLFAIVIMILVIYNSRVNYLKNNFVNCEIDGERKIFKVTAVYSGGLLRQGATQIHAVDSKGRDADIKIDFDLYGPGLVEAHGADSKNQIHYSSNMMRKNYLNFAQDDFVRIDVIRLDKIIKGSFSASLSDQSPSNLEKGALINKQKLHLTGCSFETELDRTPWRSIIN